MGFSDDWDEERRCGRWVHKNELNFLWMTQEISPFIGQHASMNPFDVQHANAVTRRIDENDRRLTDKVSSRCAFHDFIGQEIQKSTPALDVRVLAYALDAIAQQDTPRMAQSVATWVARCLVFDGASEQEPFLAALGQFAGEGPRGHRILVTWAKAASWLNDAQREPLPTARFSSLADLEETSARQPERRRYQPKAAWERWRDRLDYAELARILLTFEPELMQPAAELYYNHLAPRFSRYPRRHGGLLRAIRDLPAELYLGEETIAPAVLRRLGHLWMEVSPEEQAAVLRSCQWAAGWLLPESRAAVLGAIARAFEDAHGWRTVPIDASPSLARLAALFALLPTHLVVDIARVELARKAIPSPAGMAARAESFIFPLNEEAYARAWACDPESRWRAIIEDRHLGAIADLEAYMADNVPPEDTSALPAP